MMITLTPRMSWHTCSPASPSSRTAYKRNEGGERRKKV